MHPSRKPLIAGNWKMNKGGAAACDLAGEIGKLATPLVAQVDVVVAPPFTALAAVAHELDGTRVGVAAQNLYPKDSGAFTGEVSAPMLVECGATAVIVGHSERRQIFGETDALVAEKVAAAMAKDLMPIVCVGETLEERESGRTLAVVKRQVDAFVKLLGERPGFGVVAYEPVWAIGTGRTAGPEQAEEVHAAIRKWLGDKSVGGGAALADRTRILYGGSVNAANAAALLAAANVDGALVGGASLDVAQFGAIVRAATA